MKIQSIFQALTTGMITLGVFSAVSPSTVAQAQPKKTYFCGQSKNGNWTTFARNYNSRRIPVIYWVKKLGGYTPKTRCEVISPKFESAYKKGILNYLTSGVERGQPVICATSQYGGPCSQILFTLKSHKEASSVLQQLINVGYRAGDGGVFQSGNSSGVYIDMQRLLRAESQTK